MKSWSVLALFASGLQSCRVNPHCPYDSHLPPLEATDEPMKWKTGTFAQLIYHNDPSKGTFLQNFTYSTRFWGGPGYPIIYHSPFLRFPQPEPLGDLHWVETLVAEAGGATRAWAKKIGAAVILPQHRASEGRRRKELGQSSEGFEETISSDIVVVDNLNFARHVDLLYDIFGASHDKTPLVVSACSWNATEHQIDAHVAGWGSNRSLGLEILLLWTGHCERGSTRGDLILGGHPQWDVENWLRDFYNEKYPQTHSEL